MFPEEVRCGRESHSRIKFREEKADNSATTCYLQYFCLLSDQSGQTGEEFLCDNASNSGPPVG